MTFFDLLDDDWNEKRTRREFTARLKRMNCHALAAGLSAGSH
jgi:uncharacterized protein YdaU (DUF1376 family)